MYFFRQVLRYELTLKIHSCFLAWIMTKNFSISYRSANCECLETTNADNNWDYQWRVQAPTRIISPNLICFMKCSSRKAMETSCYCWQYRVEQPAFCRKEQWQCRAVFTTKFVREFFIHCCHRKWYYLQDTRKLHVPYPHKLKGHM